MDEQYTKEYNQGSKAGQEAHKLCPDLNVDQQVAWAQKDYIETSIDQNDFTGEKRSNFMMGFGSGYYRASRG